MSRLVRPHPALRATFSPREKDSHPPFRFSSIAAIRDVLGGHRPPLQLRFPVEGCEVTVVVSAGVVPIDAERVKMTARCVGKREPGIRRMQRVVDIQRFGSDCCAGNALTLLVEKFGNRNRSAKTAIL